MRAASGALGIWLYLTSSANAQLGNLEPCLPIPSYGRELAEYREELRSQYRSPQIHIGQITFKTQNHLPLPIQKQIASSLKKQTYDADSDWIGEVEERVQGAWQEHGYVKAAVTAKVRQRGDENQRAAVLVIVDEGHRYRLGEINFSQSSVFPVRQLRRLFPLQKGDSLDVAKLRTGLSELRKLYGTRGYINFTGVPETKVDEIKRTVSVTMQLDEGEVYRISELKILGLKPELANRLTKNSKLKPGEPFNSQLIDKFFRNNKSVLPLDAHVENDSQIERDDQGHTISLLFDFRRCH